MHILKDIIVARYDWLSQHLAFVLDIQETQDLATKWFWSYDNARTNMAIVGITPIQKLALAV